MGRNTSTAERAVMLGALVASVARDVVAESAGGLTESEVRLLWMVDPKAPPKIIGDYAELMRFDRGSLSLIGGKLERLGLARRIPFPADRRFRTLVLTPAGRRLRTRLIKDAAARMPLDALTAKEQERLFTLLTKVLTAV
ncbi:MarR family winged helix-turn-helix transcriptional regulator [Allokutzneria albata]|uniref:DNA-binding transcriptional regulator, MarR family n=1 Tax=Allokutzneria albata TaxID=211114 RepID=A0A1G9TMU2_ALLAB|nr:MarR family transcriptional regulator [Allokutzneria albata]SDM49129.1 DNA-binding transcriptional regulator, MarR family [Allokutzneria albata]